jgi:hypothetical protein
MTWEKVFIRKKDIEGWRRGSSTCFASMKPEATKSQSHHHKKKNNKKELNYTENFYTCQKTKKTTEF